MSKKRASRKQTKQSGAQSRGARPSTRSTAGWTFAKKLALGITVGSVVAIAGGLAMLRSHSSSSSARPVARSLEKAYTPRPTGTVTFSSDIAPIVFTECAGCHHPGQAAPFSLLDYAQVKKHARQIVEVTSRRYMPPWLPEHGYGEFANERRLTTDQLGLIAQWFHDGTPEGDARQLPPAPHFDGEWQMGHPDLIVDLPPYTLPAEGKDIYRNLVAPIPVSSTQFVAGVEFLPGNPRVVHHAFIDIDETRQSRRLAEKENPPGFDAMDLPDSAIMPGGQLLGWQPGKRASKVEDGLSWVLKPSTDLVLQMHLHPTGKPERVPAKVGFYFTDVPPTTVPFRIRLVRFDFEIPPGATNYVIDQSYVLPVDVKLRRILPHCHYLGKDLQAYALLPDGQKVWLLWIKDWDFNWQGDYQFAAPVSLPKGTRLIMHYGYDNSTNNPRNPNSPPIAVRNGPQTTDEMAALVLQAETRTPAERNTLAEDYFNYFRRVSMDYYEFRIKRDPKDGDAQTRLGRDLFSMGKAEEALSHLLRAVEIKPDDDRAHYELGFVYLREQRIREAYDEFQTVVRLNPEDFQAFGSLGYICLGLGQKDQARAYLQEALRLNPDDSVARYNLERLQASP